MKQGRAAAASSSSPPTGGRSYAAAAGAASTSTSTSTSAATSAPPPTQAQTQTQKAASASASAVTAPLPSRRDDSYYFDSYAHFGIHEEMLKDTVRTNAYKHAITRNPHLFKDKVVLDVGCGTGILSMFCAQAGARVVLGVDFSSITEQATEIVRANKLDHIVKIVRGRIEEVDVAAIVGAEKVDIIVSEWMGYCLLYEAMLDSVLVARDKWLKPGGLIFPDKATMYVCAIEDADYRDQKIGFWDNVYGFDYSCIKPLAMSETLVDIVDPELIVSAEPCEIFSFDISTVRREDLDFSAPFQLTAARDDYVHALVIFWTTEFSKSHRPYFIYTSPNDPYTHWKQTTVYLRTSLTMCKGETMSGTISIRKAPENPREIDIGLSYSFAGKHHPTKVVRNGDSYRMR